MAHRILALTTLALATLLAAGRAADQTSADEALLQKHLGGTDADRVIAFLKNQLLSEPSQASLKKLIEQLGDRKFAARQDASRKLVAAGVPALPLLREAAASPDKEVATRAKRAIADIEAGAAYEAPRAAVRHLVKLRHEKTVETLLQVYPAALSDAFQADILNGLKTVGASEMTAHPLLRQALDDASAARRAVAVQVLLASEDKELRKKIREKLNDADATVRFHAAIGLLPSGERAAVPVLIALIKDGPGVAIWQHVEEALYSAAGDQAPAFEVGDAKSEDRQRISEGWAAWWKARGDQILLGQKDDYPMDCAVLAETSGRVWEWTPEGKPRFEIKGLTSPVDARVLPGRRVLIAEEGGLKVSEYSFKGKLLWEKAFEDGPVSVQRLPNGNTFVATYSRFVEVRRDGSLASVINVSDYGRISDANKMRDGRIVCLFNNNQLVFFSAEGKEQVTAKMDSWGGVDSLPNGHVMVSQIHANKIVEVDGKGNVVWEFKHAGAWVGTRLPDGNTLVASQQGQKMFKVDAKGKILWEKDIDGKPHAMHWR